MPSLFLSHSSVDKPFVEKLAQDLVQVGINVWFDKWAINVGESLTWRVMEGVQENDYFALVLSPDALASEWVRNELSAAWCRQMSERRIIVLPIMYRDCCLPSMLADRKYADFRTDYNAGLLELCRVLGLKHAESITENNWRLFMGDQSVDWKRFREEEFAELVTRLVRRADEYRWSVWTGRTKNPYSITLSAFVSPEKRDCLSIRMVKGAYMAADHTDINPNNTKLSAYTIYVGNTVNECEEYVWRRMETFRRTFGDPTEPPHRSTFRTLHEADKRKMIMEFLQKMHWDQRLPQVGIDDPEEPEGRI